MPSPEWKLARPDDTFRFYFRSIIEDILGKDGVAISWGWKYAFIRGSKVGEYRIDASKAKKAQMSGKLREFLETEVAIWRIRGG